jgi:S-adenosylmethionine/arginine decarboxylase-like enzyme
MSWGYHLMLDCANCNDGIKDRDNIVAFVKELIPAIDMVAHGEPIVEFLLPGDPKEGYSMMQLITTSNITAHFMEPDYTAYFDIFSCKDFDLGIPQELVRKYFGEDIRMAVHFQLRQAPI